MINSLAIRFARPLSIHCALGTLSRVSTHALIIAPAAHGTIAFAQALSRVRPCVVTRGPVTASVPWQHEDILRSASEISHAFAGQPTLTRTVISFPDQLPCSASTCVLLPFLDQPHAFSTLDALVVMRHRPRVFALSSTSRRWGMRVFELSYADAFDADGRLCSLHGLMSVLLSVLASDLAAPPPDWLAREYLAQRSERVLWLQEREELKDIECLLRMQLQSRFCDQERTGAALDAVIHRQKVLIGAALP
jgi:hypothetical protein